MKIFYKESLLVRWAKYFNELLNVNDENDENNENEKNTIREYENLLQVSNAGYVEILTYCEVAHE